MNELGNLSEKLQELQTQLDSRNAERDALLKDRNALLKERDELKKSTTRSIHSDDASVISDANSSYWQGNKPRRKSNWGWGGAATSETISELSKLKSQVEQLNEEAEQNQKKIESLEHEKTAFEVKLMILEQEFERTSTEAKELQAAANAPLDEKKFDGMDLHGQIFELQRALEAASQGKQKAEEDAEFLRKEAEQIRETAKKSSDALNQEIEQLKKIQEDYEQKVKALESVIEAISSENQSMLDSSVKQQSLGSGPNSDLQAELAKVQQEKLELETTMEKQLMAFEQANQMVIEDLRMQLKSRETAISMLEQEIADYRHEQRRVVSV
eukprot:CAMPEP_0202460096 /NCGR_PEP_ID=MMETSP1360-20130828/41492_1 /ASSEMBLY_ACC=CAM_ASM_000848 /TAXON_ID=515479 /ORGANISM="Licmophora paradoxa, Strain CCMP2313" /LENGTH=327 /DNA_ID=CAMNT_0049081589 /DNA_START=1 /DNA_END=984 /DNA_ORIENTATION=-